MKCQILFAGKNKKNIINLLSAELAQRVIKVNMLITNEAENIFKFYFILIIFQRKIRLSTLCEPSA